MPQKARGNPLHSAKLVKSRWRCFQRRLTKENSGQTELEKGISEISVDQMQPKENRKKTLENEVIEIGKAKPWNDEANQ